MGSQSSLRPDCGRCFGLCCVAPAFSASADFAIDKDAGQACPHLRPDFRCGIHDQLRPRGFPGCAVYDCFGAGQKVAQVTYGGRDWRRTPAIAQQMFKVFAIMRQLHELLWYLGEAIALRPAGPLLSELSLALERTEQLTYGSPGALVDLDVNSHRQHAGALLRRTSELVRGGARAGEIDLAGADLTGKDLTGAGLSGASLRGARLIGAELAGADLRLADVIGADFRGAGLAGADLTTSIFLTQSQVDAAMGDHSTKLPPSLIRPPHWPLRTGRIGRSKR
jgi:Pentapeptide repeats (8 copies)